jgi:hypothetical protein
MSWRPIMTKLTVLGIVGGAALLTALPISLQCSQQNVALSLDVASARVGRPLTALSVAGVQRRAYRRAARGAIYAGVAAAIGYGLSAYYGGYGYPGYAYSAPYYGGGYGYGGYGYGPYGYTGYSTAPYNPGPNFGWGFGY